ncbi:MAG: hypothetical protein D6765_05170 [Bacteroidetes bacterium]|nr:MAG: hypothetical protein D6765_05170 [Bacteroidota bacterium]
MKSAFRGLLFVSLVLSFSCQHEPVEEGVSTASPLFQLRAGAETGLDFVNEIVENDTVNYFSFMHMYMGAGVAAGDVNNDGLSDLFFVSNLGQPRLYLNRGELRFEDVSSQAGIAVVPGFSTGAAMADVNGDGWLDIYLCRSGWFQHPEPRRNLLFLNNGDGTFTESAQAWGVDDDAPSIQAAFLDYDHDGDADLFLVNTPVAFELTSVLLPLDQVHQSKDLRRFKGYDRLFRNDGNRFTDVTEQAGILSDIGFGLGVVAADFNQDGWTDIYVANDFMTPDALYINQGDGTFRERNRDFFKHTSFYSMGADVADINNDGWNDLFVLDMLPEDYKRSKITMEMVDPKAFFQAVEWGYNYQYMHNVLHLNNGNETFSEIGQLAGITKTDWSWSALLADFDLDGWRDLFVSNGILRDVTERDYKAKIKALKEQLGRPPRFSEFEHLIPSHKLPNYAFRNRGDLTFEKVSEAWGVALPSFSTGAAVADLDNDGDLDIVTNNSNEPAFLFENTAERSRRHFLKVQLQPAPNTTALNARVFLRRADGSLWQSAEMTPVRGYMSSSEPIVHFGLGQEERVPILEVVWPDGKLSRLEDVPADQTLRVPYRPELPDWQPPARPEPLFAEESATRLEPPFVHRENAFDDFRQQILLPHRQSQNGPPLAVGDVNGDGLEDFFVGGAKDQAAALYLQTPEGRFRRQSSPHLEKDRTFEDTGALFFDADGDGDLDLYVVSGGVEWPAGSSAYQDRLYRNDGRGRFSLDAGALPEIRASGGCVAAADYDRDGDLDLFVGGRIIPDQYPYPPRSFLLRNDGHAFHDATPAQDPNLPRIGMVCSAVWTDFNGDDLPDLVLAGEWMNIEFFENQNGRLALVTAQMGFERTRGWWNKLLPTDLDQDGDTDFLAGNLGLNYKFHTSPDKPFRVFCNDFDGNGTYDIVLAKNIGERYVPVRGRTCSSEQMPFIKEKFPTFNAFADAGIEDIFGREKLDEALQYEAHLFETVLLRREGDSYRIEPLPLQAQIAPVTGGTVGDFTGDGRPDLLIAGNKFGAEVETTRADAGIGLLLEGSPEGAFRPVHVLRSGFFAPHDVRDLQPIQLADGRRAVLVANNDQPLQLFVPRKSEQRIGAVEEF